MPNQELFVDVLAHIEIEKDKEIGFGFRRWHQNEWAAAVIPASDVVALNPGVDIDELPWRSLDLRDLQVPPCKSAFCAAGWAVELSGLGGEIAWSVTDVFDGQAELQASGVKGDDDYVYIPISQKASELLGIEEYGDWAAGLFEGHNSLGDLYSISAHLLRMEDEDELRRLVQVRIAELRGAGAEEVRA